MTTNLDDNLRQLRLPTMARRWSELHERALNDNWSMPDWLAALCSEELAQRDNQRLARYLKLVLSLSKGTPNCRRAKPWSTSSSNPVRSDANASSTWRSRPSG